MRKNYIEKEWNSLQKYCINKEDFPYSTDYDSFRDYFLRTGGYYGGHTHPFKLILLSGEWVGVDYGISDLIETLNKSGFSTRFCCSGHSGENGRNYAHGYIYFDPNIEMEKILQIEGLTKFSNEKVVFSTDQGNYIVRFHPTYKVRDEEVYYKYISDIILRGLGIMKVGDKIRIIRLNDCGYDFQAREYSGREGVITSIDDIGQLHGTWGGLAVIPGEDEFEII